MNKVLSFVIVIVFLGGIFALAAIAPEPAPLPLAPEVVAGECYIGGCSGQICSDEKDVASNCEYREEYGCHKTATCERQPTGECGWTPSAELTACIDEATNTDIRLEQVIY